MGQSQENDRPDASRELTGWRRWTPRIRWTNRKALDSENRPDTPRVGSFQEQQDNGPRMAIVEWIFRI